MPIDEFIFALTLTKEEEKNSKVYFTSLKKYWEKKMSDFNTIIWIRTIY